MRSPPLGMIARFNGASVWSPTISSRSWSMYPGGNAVMPAGVAVSTSWIPRARSSGNNELTAPHTMLVRSVGPLRKVASPSNGVRFRRTKSATSMLVRQPPSAKPCQAPASCRTEPVVMAALLRSSRTATADEPAHPRPTGEGPVPSPAGAERERDSRVQVPRR